MTARRAVWWACHWLAVFAAAYTATLPFTGPYASAAGLLAATAISLIGIATAPHPGARQ